MAYQILGNVVISQPIAETSTTQKEKLGRVVQAVDPTYGVGEFIYLKGVANTDVGDGVTYDAATYQTAISSIAVGVSRAQAIAMSANVANQYGWYQIGGNAVVGKASSTSFAAAAALGITSGLAVAAATTLRLTGAVVQAAASGASAVTSVVVAINRPSGPASD